MTESYRTCVVVNPRSSNGATARRWPTIESKLRGVLEHVTVFETEGAGHATELTRKGLREGYAMVVAVGGDGTVNEVVNGFFEAGEKVVERPILGLLPSGTGGDYRKTWNLGVGVDDAVLRLGGQATKTVDMGRVDWVERGTPKFRYFANIASLGLGGAASRQANEQSKILGGKASFFIASARALLGYTNKDIVMTTDGGDPRHSRTTLAAFSIGRFFGGGMMVAPNADPCDGKFDIISIDDASKLEMLAMTSIYKGQHLDHPNVTSWQGVTVHVDGAATGPERVVIEADGEVFGALPATFSVVPGAFEIKV